MSQHIGRYCELGWRILRLSGVVSPEVCSCPAGARCPTPGKHPIERAWHLNATSDEDTVMRWLEDGGDAVNIGILLGRESGVIDIELDGEDAKESWESLGLGEIWTPTYRAGRGPHRLFKWRDDLPPVATKKAMGIEFRIGSNGRACQSVLPPSTHHSGVKYEWVDGLSPSDVDVADIPDKLVRLLWNDSSPASATVFTPASTILHTRSGEGSRNNDLYRFACAEGFRCHDINNPQEQQDLLAKIVAVNKTQCSPPLQDREVVQIYRSAVSFVRKTDAAGVPVATAMEECEKGITEKKKKGAPTPRDRDIVKSFTEQGLSHAPPRDGGDPEYWPGEWTLTVVHADPIEYRLSVPAWVEWTANRSGNVTLTVLQYRSAPKVAAAVLAATGVVMLDDDPIEWKKIWDGGGKKRKKHVRGLKAKLLDNAMHEWPGASSLRYVALAGWLYDRLSQASQPNEDDTPDPSGRAAWRVDGTLWWNWTKVWEDIERNHRVFEGERQALKRRILGSVGEGVQDFDHREFRHSSGTRKKYVVWTKKEFKALEELANEDRIDGQGPQESSL